MTGTPYQYRPSLFFLIAYAITWPALFAAAYFSTRGGPQELLGLLMFLGMCGPLVAALVMF